MMMIGEEGESFAARFTNFGGFSINKLSFSLITLRTTASKTHR